MFATLQTPFAGLNKGTLINWIMASINYRVEAFQNAGVDAQFSWKFTQVYHTHKFFALIRSILGEPGGIGDGGRNRDHREMSWRNKPHSQHLDRLLFGADLCVSLSAPPRVRPMRSRSGLCSKCSSAEAETDSTPVCFPFAFHSSLRWILHVLHSRP